MAGARLRQAAFLLERRQVCGRDGHEHWLRIRAALRVALAIHSAGGAGPGHLGGFLLTAERRSAQSPQAKASLLLRLLFRLSLALFVGVLLRRSRATRQPCRTRL